MASVWKDFKKFAFKGNIVDLAVAVIIGGAFGKIVTSMVNDLIMPLIGIFLGGLSFTSLSFKFGSAVIKYGAFIQTVVDFFIISATLFCIVRMYLKFLKKEEEKPKTPSEPSNQEVLLTEIRDLLSTAVKNDSFGGPTINIKNRDE